MKGTTPRGAPDGTSGGEMNGERGQGEGQETGEDVAVHGVTDLASRHGLIVEPGRMVLELRPPGMDKGVALLEYVREIGAEGRCASSDRFQGADDLVGFGRRAPVMDGHVPAVSAERQRDSSPETLRCASHENDGSGWHGSAPTGPCA